MSEIYQDSQENLISETSQLAVNTRVLWTGIQTTNRSLDANTSKLVKLSKDLTEFALVLNNKITELTMHLRTGIESLIKSMFVMSSSSQAIMEVLHNYIQVSQELRSEFQNLSQAGLLAEEEGEGKTKGEKAKKGAFELAKVAAGFGKRQVLKALQHMTGVLNKFQEIALSPILAGILKPLEAIGTIFKIILIPLKPLLFGLELLAGVLEAAFAPIMIEVWEGLSPVFDAMVESIPALTEIIWEWIDSQGGIEGFIKKIADALLGLLNALLTGDLLSRLTDLAFGILDLAIKITQPETLESLIVLAEAVMWIADIVTGVFKKILEWLATLDVGQIAALFYIFALMFTWLQTFTMLGGGPWGALGATIATGIVAGVLGSLLFFQEGGTVPETGPIYAHKGETVHSVGKDDQIIELLEQQNYLQQQMLVMKEDRYR